MISNLINVLTAPASTYETILEQKSWREALLPIIFLFVLAMFTGWLLQDLIADFQWTESERRIENMTQLSAEQKSDLLDKTYERVYGGGSGKYFGFIMMGLTWPIRILVMSLMAMLVGNMFFGGSGSYGKVFAITSFAYSASIVEYLVKTPLQYFTDNIKVYTGLGLLDLGEEGSFLFNFMAGVDIFSFWRIILISIGMGVLYRKSTKSFIVALTVLWLVGLAIFSSLGAVFS